MKRRIDVHCHLFNRKVFSALMAFGILRMIKDAEIELKRSKSIVERRRLTRSVRSSVSFFLTALKSQRGILSDIQKYEKNYIFAPLMLDTYWISQSPKTNISKSAEKNIAAVLRKELDRLIVSIDRRAISRKATLDSRFSFFALKRIAIRLRRVLKNQEQEKEEIIAEKCGISDTYPLQEKLMEDLVANNPTIVYPFFSVDPRRTSNYARCEDGSFDISSLTDRLKINGGIFQGFKLYTPCGYSPTHPMLMALYDYCEAHEVPIIAHVSGSGVTTFANELFIEGDIYKDGQLIANNGIWTFTNKQLFSRDRILEHSERLNHPMLWEKVLTTHPFLKLDMAHFGHLPHTNEWTEYIWNKLLLKKNARGEYAFPNLYIDFACIPDLETLSDFHDDYFCKQKDLQCRFMYGSDYYMNLVYLKSMRDYCNNFKQVFSNEEFDAISIDNPCEFLGLN